MEVGWRNLTINGLIYNYLYLLVTSILLEYRQHYDFSTKPYSCIYGGARVSYSISLYREELNESDAMLFYILLEDEPYFPKMKIDTS